MPRAAARCVPAAVRRIPAAARCVRATVACVPAGVLACLASGAPAQTLEPSFDAYLTVTSDAIHRGLSQSDGDTAVQAGLDYTHPSGAFAGVSAANVEFAADDSRPGPRDITVDYYAGYAGRRGAWDWTLAVARYTYPDTALDYDYNELSVTVAYRQRVSYSVAASDDFQAFLGRSIDHEIALAWPLPWSVELGAAVGRLDADRLPGGGHEYWHMGASKLLRRVAVDLRYYDVRGATSPYLGRPADGRWVLSLSSGFELGAGR